MVDTAHLVDRDHPTGLKVPDDPFAAIALHTHEIQPLRKTIRPR